MDPARAFFLGNRIWWSGALFLGPIVGAVTAGPVGAVAATVLLVLPSMVVFDERRPWWPNEVRRQPDDPERSRVELRKLTLWSGISLIAGVAVALASPWS
jgi:hypothetical protein